MAMQMIGTIMSHDETRRACVMMETRASFKGPKFTVETQLENERKSYNSYWDLFSATEAAAKFVKG